MKMDRFFVIILFSLCIMYSKSDISRDIHFIISYKLNGTAAFAPLEYVNPGEKYIYFSFDFKYHSLSVPLSKNKAYFSIESDFDLFVPHKEGITFGFSEKKWTFIRSDKDIENIEWKNIKFTLKKKEYDDSNYYYEIEKPNDKINTMLIRIPVNGRNEGYITIENIKGF